MTFNHATPHRHPNRTFAGGLSNTTREYVVRPILKKQEIPYDHPDSKWMFDPDADIAVAITPGAKAIYNDYAYELLAILTELARRHGGLYRL